uniref:Uncharacterized protein n=1 Tax=Rhizophora mucronata TaxID=61149 RepID=A0A2P2R190_RHIMU
MLQLINLVNEILGKLSIMSSLL